MKDISNSSNTYKIFVCSRTTSSILQMFRRFTLRTMTAVIAIFLLAAFIVIRLIIGATVACNIEYLRQHCGA